MITQRYFERDRDRVLFRIAVDERSVLDVLTTDAALERCRQLLQASRQLPSEATQMGTFGPFIVTLIVWRDEATLLIDGPELGDAFSGGQAAGLYLERNDLLLALDEAADYPRKTPL